MEDLHLGMLEVYVVTDHLFHYPIMTPQSNLRTNLNWDRLCLKPIQLAKLKPRLRSGSVRIALATGAQLRFMTITRHPRLAGRKAKRVEQGYWEVYESGVGWVKIQNECEIWLHP